MTHRTHSSLTRPDDWHLHLRDGAHLRAVVGATAQVFGRAIVMPNLRPPVTTTAAARDYRERIRDALPAGSCVRAADDALPDRRHAGRGDRAAPGRAVSSTRSSTTRPARRRIPQSGVTTLARALPGARGDGARRASCCRSTARSPIPDVDVFDRERVFVERAPRGDRARLSRRCASCSSTSRRARPWSSCEARRRNVAATITPQHLLLFAQRAVRGRAAAASVLPAGAEARDASAGARRRRDVGQARSSFSAPTRRRMRGRQGERLRLRRLLFGAGRAAAVCRSVRGRRRARPPRRLRERARPGVLRLAAQRRDRSRWCANAWRVPDTLPFGDETIVPLRAGANAALARRATTSSAPIMASRSQPDRRCPARQLRGRGKSGLHRAGCRVTPGRRSRDLAASAKARNRATETSRFRISGSG